MYGLIGKMNAVAGKRDELLDILLKSTARMPGSNTPVVLTDRASELQSPGAEAADPATSARAESLNFDAAETGKAPPEMNFA